MELTRDFKETVKERAGRDPAFAERCSMKRRRCSSTANNRSFRTESI